MAVCNHGNSKRMQRGLKEVVVTEPLLICTYVCVERVYFSLLSQIWVTLWNFRSTETQYADRFAISHAHTHKRRPSVWKCSGFLPSSRPGALCTDHRSGFCSGKTRTDERQHEHIRRCSRQPVRGTYGLLNLTCHVPLTYLSNKHAGIRLTCGSQCKTCLGLQKAVIRAETWLQCKLRHVHRSLIRSYGVGL